MSWGPAWTLFVRVGLSGCRRAVSGLPGPCGPYCSRVRLVRRLVDPLDQALRGSDHGKIWASVCPTAGRLGPRRSESIRAAGRVTWRVWPWVRSGSMHAQGSDVPGSDVRRASSRSSGDGISGIVDAGSFPLQVPGPQVQKPPGRTARAATRTCVHFTCLLQVAAQGTRTPFSSPAGEQRGGLG